MWLQHAAAEGYAKAQYRLGIMCAEGTGVKQDYKQALEWFRRAAEQGFVPAQYRLSLLYAKGRGVVQDYFEAYKWCYAAARTNESYALKALEKIAVKIDTAKLAEAGRLGEELVARFTGMPAADGLSDTAEIDIETEEY
jgi:TPR repeat protein